MGKKAKILIIDDDLDIILQVEKILKSEGFEVISAKTGIEGIDRVRLDKPDLILLDLMIESHDTGFKVAKAIKGDPATRNIPIIMVSAVRNRTGFDFNQERDGHWMKTNTFLDKPYEPSMLIAKIHELLPTEK